MDGSVFEEKSSFKLLGLTFFSKPDWSSYIISIATTAYKKVGALKRMCKTVGPSFAASLEPLAHC